MGPAGSRPAVLGVALTMIFSGEGRSPSTWSVVQHKLEPLNIASVTWLACGASPPAQRFLADTQPGSIMSSTQLNIRAHSEKYTPSNRSRLAIRRGSTKPGLDLRPQPVVHEAGPAPTRDEVVAAAAFTDTYNGVAVVRRRAAKKSKSAGSPPVGPPPPVAQQAQNPSPAPMTLQASQQAQPLSQQAQTPVEQDMASLPDAAWAEFEARLEADLQTVGWTLVAIVGVIVFWRGVWSLLDYLLGDNPIGDVCCILVGFGIIIWIRLSGRKISSFWPSG